MAVDKLVDSSQLDLDLTSVANAIRAKSGGSSVLLFPAGFVSEINSIVAGGPTLDDWLADNIDTVNFSGSTIKAYAFAYHNGPNGNGIAFNLPSITAIPEGAFIESTVKSFSAPLVSSISGTVFTMRFPQSGNGVIVAFPSIVTLHSATSLKGFAAQNGTICPVLLSLPAFTGRTSTGSASNPLFGSSDGIVINYACGINEITQDAQKGVLPASGVRVYIPLMTFCLPYDFAYLKKLVTAELPNFTSLANYAFYGCQALTTVDISSVTTIGNYAFAGCQALTTIDCSDATTIGQYAFYMDTALATISLPSATQIRDFAFSGCTALEDADLGNAATIGPSCFRGCTALEEVTVHAATSISANAFYGCGNLTTVTAPSITSVGQYAFYNCTNLANIDLRGVTTLSAYAFQRCTSLTSVDLKSATGIPRSTFEECTALKTVTVRKNANLNSQAFYNASNMDTFIIDLDDPDGALPTMSAAGTSVFQGTKITTSGGGYIYVNDDRVNELKTKTNWTSVASLIKPLSELPSA